MRLIEFKEQTEVLAKNQPQYKRLPVHVVDEPEGRMIFCMKFTLKERVKFFFTGKLWVSQMTFKKPFQPVFASVHKTDFFVKVKKPKSPKEKKPAKGMYKNMHTKRVVPITPKNLIHSWLYRLVFFCIKKGWFTNAGKFKQGDLVKYNWKSRVYINSIYEGNKGKVFQVESTKLYTDESDIVYFSNDSNKDSASSFWLRKLYWWESKKGNHGIKGDKNR